MTTNQVDTALADYYKLKGKYDSNYNQRKSAILRSDISRADKRKKIALLRSKCVKCGRSVGTVFSRRGRTVQAKCGDSTAPCTLNIEINQGDYAFGPALAETVAAHIEEQKKRIIELKLNLLFGIEIEETTLEMFEKVKTSYKESIATLKSIDAHLNGDQLVQIDEIGGGREISKKELVKINRIELANLVKTFKTLISELDESESEESKLKELEDAIDIYLTQIVPALTIIRDNLYDVSTVIYEDKKFRLVQLETSLSQQQITIEPAEIISNIK